MLLDIGTVFAGIGLAIVGFIVVILVCAVILALLAAILPSYEGRTTAEQRDKTEAGAADAAGSAPTEETSTADPDGVDTVRPPAGEDPSPAIDIEGDPDA